MRNGKSVLKTLALIFGLVGAAMAAAGGLIFACISKMRLLSAVMCLIGLVFLLTAFICYAAYWASAKKKRDLIENGTLVSAQITEIGIDPHQEIQVDRIAMNPYYIRCRYVGADGKELRFKSGMLLYNPSGLLTSDRIKVYVDLRRPSRYYVDTNEILPEGAILHKFKRDIERKAAELVRGGKYVTAVTCGVELIGMIKLNGIVTQRFLKLPKRAASRLGLSVDGQGRAFVGYTVLCKHTANDGTIHVFASKCIWGEPSSSHIGEEVRVYYDGKGYKNYHVAEETLVKRGRESV